MEDISITFLRDSEIDGEILIEGLPGVGQVGKLVADHLIDELDAEKIAEVHSIFFPPQVVIDGDGVAHLAKNEFYRYHDGTRGIIFLVGDFQSNSPEGHYLLSDAYLNAVEQMGVTRIYTLGGYGVGHMLDSIRVLGSVNNIDLKESVEELGVNFPEESDGGGIIGASGLLLGLSAQRGMEGICLMGETSGYLVDPLSASVVLEILCKLIGVDVSSAKLHERAGEMEPLVNLIRKMESAPTDEELSYIG